MKTPHPTLSVGEGKEEDSPCNCIEQSCWLGSSGCPWHGAWGVAQAPHVMGEVTVDDLVARALADNLDLQATQAEVDAAHGRLQQAGLRPNPMLDLGVQKNVAGPDNNLTASVTLPLDLNGRRAGRVGVAERELEIKRAQVADRARRLRAEVRMKAGELLAAQRNLRFTEALLQVNRDALGSPPHTCPPGSRAAAGRESAPCRGESPRGQPPPASQARWRSYALQLKTLVGLAPEAPLSLQGDLHPAPVRLELSEGLSRALAARSDLLIARAEVAMAEAMIRKEKAEGALGRQRQRRLYAAGFWLRSARAYGARGSTQPIQDVFHYVGAGVTITLPIRNRNQGNIATAMASTTAAQRRLASVTLTIRQEVTAAFTQYEAAQRALDIYTQGVREVARQNLEVVRQTYDLGRAIPAGSDC